MFLIKAQGCSNQASDKPDCFLPDNFFNVGFCSQDFGKFLAKDIPSCNNVSHTNILLDTSDFMLFKAFVSFFTCGHIFIT